MKITDTIKYVGVNDHKVDLFEGQYPVANGMAYNSYVILDEKIAVMDTAPSLLGWLWCVLRLRGIRGRVCGHCAWFAGMIVVCVYVCVVCVAFRGL